jgi:hypothetical protein
LAQDVQTVVGIRCASSAPLSCVGSVKATAWLILQSFDNLETTVKPVIDSFLTNFGLICPHKREREMAQKQIAQNYDRLGDTACDQTLLGGEPIVTTFFGQLNQRKALT